MNANTSLEKTIFSLNTSFLHKKLLFLVAVLLALSIFCRYINLDQKVYNADEVRGIQRLAGYTSAEVIDSEFTGEIIRAKDLQKYQFTSPEKSLEDALKAFSGNPEHPPLYYLLARFSVQIFQNPVGARLLAVSTSLLIFPCIYYLCLMLFNSPAVGLIAIALTAASPLHMLYAQEARQHSLWMLTILLSSMAFLKAIRAPKIKNWVIYLTTIVLGLYAHLFFIWVIISQSLYVAVTQRLKLSKTLVSQLITASIGLTCFLPWIWVIISNSQQFERKTSWTRSYEISLLERVELWFNNASLAFVNIDYELSPQSFIPYFFIGLIIYSIYFLCRNTPRRTWVFILLLIGVIAVGQVLPDLLLGGRRSITPRYLLPSYLGIQIAIAFLLKSKLTQYITNSWQKKFWSVFFAFLISVGVFSCAIGAQDRVPWTKGSNSIMNLQIASIVNRSSHPLVISDAYESFLFSLANLLKPEVKLQVFTGESLAEKIDTISTEIAQDFDEIFIYFPSKPLSEKLSKTFDLEIVLDDDRWFKEKVWLYKVAKPKISALKNFDF